MGVELNERGERLDGCARFYLCLRRNEPVEMVEMAPPAWLGCYVRSVLTGEVYRVENYMTGLELLTDMEVLAWAAS